MKVKMKTTTNWKGKLRRPGDVLTVDDTVAKRWERYGLAEVIGEKRGKKEVPDDAPVAGNDLESMPIEDLRKMAEDLGIAPGNMKKADLIAAIRKG
ncbi:MAG TPA: Rho termination factor N-terminal domain-containing protein [Bacillota bacterium]|nr:Rho termination factor N-terminal domain-containing protein [Bacillota bacterium]